MTLDRLIKEFFRRHGSAVQCLENAKIRLADAAAVKTERMATHLESILLSVEDYDAKRRLYGQMLEDAQLGAENATDDVVIATLKAQLMRQAVRAATLNTPSGYAIAIRERAEARAIEEAARILDRV